MMRVWLTVAFLCAAWPAVADEKITKQTLSSGGVERAYYLLVPDTAKGKPAPLIVMLHGSGRNGKILLEHWQGLARKEGIVLVGPDANERQGWHMLPDGPHFLHDLVEAVKQSQSIDPKRVYVFGHSAGAIHGLALGVLESEYFAAVAAHAGVITEDVATFVERAPRKIPIALWIGTNDRLFPLNLVRSTHKALVSRGFAAELTEIKGHTHDYYGRSGSINKEVWAFLQKHQLEGDPKYQVYNLGK